MNSNKNGSRFLAEMSVGRLMLKFSLPCVISLLIGAVYNMTDQVFVGRGVGYLGNGATTVVFPLTMIALAIATMIGDGACTAVSIYQGQGDMRKAKNTVCHSIMMTIAASIVLTVIYACFRDSLLRVFGATEANMTYAVEYFNFLIPGIPVYMFGQAMNPVIRADGSPRFAMFSTLGGAVFNMVFDPILIFGFGMGMTGAAIATVAGQIVTAVMAVWYISHMKLVRIDRSSWSVHPRLAGRICSLGFCSFLTQVSVVISLAVTNNMLIRYGASSEIGADIPLTVIGVVSKFLQIVNSIAIGLAAGCIPVIGYNIGAGLHGRVRKITRFLLAAELVTGAAATVIFQVFPRQLTVLFGSGGDMYMDFAVKTFRTYLCLIILTCFNKGVFILMQAMGKPVESSVLSFIREVALNVPALVIMPMLMGLDGILWTMPLCEAITTIISLIVLTMTDRKLAAAESVSPGDAPAGSAHAA